MATGPGARSAATGRLVESERAALPRVVGRPHALVRSLLAQPYTGIAPETARHRLLLSATARVSLVVKIDDSPYRPPGFVQGTHDRYAVVDGECARSYLEVGMAPLGAYRLLGQPIDELGDAVVDLQDVFGAQGRRLVELIRDEPTWRGRFALVDRFLMNAASRGPEPSAEVAWAWCRIVESRGTTAIGPVATEVGWSHRRLITRFARQVGLTPKKAARLVRFEHLLAHVTTDRTTPWPVAAVEAGYADQAHMIRDFHAFTGVTPTEYVARRGAKFVQYPGAARS
jgi:AraC-like DNA-binding protein